MNQTVKNYLVSSLTTFLTAFFGTLALSLQSGHLMFTLAFVLSILSVGARAGVKAVVESFVGSADPVPPQA
jgi:hypothetical protein